jgi:phenylalanyl-tRNA synthetase alpha chain
MTAIFSETQKQRLKELEAAPEERSAEFDDAAERNRAFQMLETRLVKKERERLDEFRQSVRRPRLATLENELAQCLADAGFVQVTTPIIMSKHHLAKMGIDDSHPLAGQVHWIGSGHCLRPMLAPHLYYVIRDLLRIWDKPVSLFEVGPCFRKETQGAAHLGEFTMLNLTEFGLPEENRNARLEELAALVMSVVGLNDYQIVRETSEVYGETIDIEAGPNRLEVGSCAMGPHFLDGAWGIVDTWVGLGFGLERLLMAKGGHESIGRVGRSLAYLGGCRLNV